MANPRKTKSRLRAVLARADVTQSELAAAMSETPQTIHNWIVRGVPAERVLDVEVALGKFVRHELRPDVFGAAPPAHTPTAPAIAEAVPALKAA